MGYLQKKIDKIAYLRGMVRLSKANGEVAKEEVDYIEAAAAGMGLDEKELAELHMLWASESEVKQSFTNKDDAAFFIQEAIQLCSVDGSYDESERREIRKISEEIGISDADVVAIENWVAEGIAWRKHGEALVKEISARV
ncbi:hypothetical protein OBV_34710 [Oscillibacter valericigenes Sjm18-20]|nr:hypothetical protein OBV_34710 [Oscillibacter valericigenes Sjm18-20]